MNGLLNYVLQVILTSGILYSYYHYALRNKKFHHYNRFYLLAATVLSLLIPFLNIPVYFTKAQTESSFVYNTLAAMSGGGSGESGTAVYTGPVVRASWFTAEHIVQTLYLLVAAMVLSRVIFSLLKIRRIIRGHAVEQIGTIRFVNTAEPGTPFSFFRWLFWNREIELRSEKGEQIFRHELFHIEEKHSWDIIYIELLTIAGWVNPFFHLVKKELRTIHEFLADQFAVREDNRWQYAELLLMQALNTKQSLIHPFFHNQVKRRIAMITSPQKTSHQYLRKMMVLPLTALAVILFAFSYKNSKKAPVPGLQNEKHTIVIDIGHGGTDHGAVGPDGISEKDLVFAIAQKIRSLNTNEQLNILFTRNEDVLPPLKSRTDLARQQEADLFLSLHINSSPDPDKTGFEVYIPKNATGYLTESRQLGSVLLQQLSVMLPADKQLKQGDQTIWVLENSDCPAVLLECGYMSNTNDLSFISGRKNQEQIAGKILEAIHIFFDNRLAAAGSENSATDTTVKPAHNVAVIGKMVFISDRIIFRSAPAQDPKNNIPESIAFMNGKRIFKKDYEGKAILCDSIEIYSKEDKKAIALYGPQARGGVMVIYNGKITGMEIKEATKPEAGKVFDKVEIEAAFPGGESPWRRYLERNLDVQLPVKNKAPRGVYTVIVQFIVNTDGSISDTRALTNHGFGMEAEAIRAIKKGPKWIPAIQNGRQVRAYHMQPITYVVDDGPKKEGTVAVGEGKVLNEVVVVSYSDPTNPTFPGGDSAWKKYLIVNANPLVPANNAAPEGIYKTRIRFIVHPDGTISDITALTHFGYGMEEEAIRLIKNGPRWIPATREGTKVSSYKEQPITFELTGEPDRPSYPPIIPSIKLTNITSPRLANGKLLKLDPGTIYIGLTNTLLLETSENEIKYITAESGNGNMLKIENRKIEIQANSVKDQYAIKLFYTKDNIKTTVKTVNFPVRLVPQQ